MANKNNSAKKIDLSSVKKINFAKLKRLKAVNIISKFAIYFVLICIGFIFLEPIFEMISKSIMTTKDLIDPSITWIAKHATLDNFKNAIGTLDIPTSILVLSITCYCSDICISNNRFRIIKIHI